MTENCENKIPRLKKKKQSKETNIKKKLLAYHLLDYYYFLKGGEKNYFLIDDDLILLMNETFFFNNECNERNEYDCLESMNAGVQRMKRIWRKHASRSCRQICFIRRTLAFIVLLSWFVLFVQFVVQHYYP